MTPIVDVSRCTRSEDCVVLVLSPPQSIHDVIDQYEIHYCSEEQKSLEIEVIYLYIFLNIFLLQTRAVVVVIVWWLD
jgi:hypothetical protein